MLSGSTHPTLLHCVHVLSPSGTTQRIRRSRHVAQATDARCLDFWRFELPASCATSASVATACMSRGAQTVAPHAAGIAKVGWGDSRNDGGGLRDYIYSFEPIDKEDLPCRAWRSWPGCLDSGPDAKDRGTGSSRLRLDRLLPASMPWPRLGGLVGTGLGKNSVAASSSLPRSRLQLHLNIAAWKAGRAGGRRCAGGHRRSDAVSPEWIWSGGGRRNSFHPTIRNGSPNPPLTASTVSVSNTHTTVTR